MTLTRVSKYFREFSVSWYLLLFQGAAVFLLPVIFYLFVQAPYDRLIQSYLGYYLCLALSFLYLLWFPYTRGLRAIVTWKSEQNDRPIRLIAYCLCGLATLWYVVLAHEPMLMRVFNDEPSHYMTSIGMLRAQIAASPESGFYELGGYVTRGMEPVYRMYFFPFLLSLLHGLLGESPQNVFILNATLTGLLILSLLVLARVLSPSKRVGLSGFFVPIFFFGFPVASYVANSGGYDILNQVALVQFLIVLCLYAKSENSDLLNFTIVCGLILSYCRNESVLFLGCFVIVYLWKALKYKRLDLTWFSVVSPIFLIGVFAARSLQSGIQLGVVYGEMGELGFFHWSYFAENLDDSLKWLFEFGDADKLSNPLLAWFAIILLAFAFVRIGYATAGVSQRIRFDSRDVVLGSLVCMVLLHLTMICFLYWSPTEASAIRFFLPLMLTLGLIVWRYSQLSGLFANKFVGNLLFGVTLLIFWQVSIPVSARAVDTYRSNPGTLQRGFNEWAQRNDDGKTLFIYRAPYTMLKDQIPAITLDLANIYSRGLKTLLNEGVYDRIIYFEGTSFDEESQSWIQPLQLRTLDEDFHLALVDRWRSHARLNFSVYEVSLPGIKGETFDASTQTPFYQFIQGNRP